MILSSQDPSGDLPTFQTSPATSLFLQQGPPLQPHLRPPSSLHCLHEPTLSSPTEAWQYMRLTHSRARRQPHLNFYTVSYNPGRPGGQPHEYHKRGSGPRVRSSCQPGESFGLPPSTHNTTRRALPPQTEPTQVARRQQKRKALEPAWSTGHPRQVRHSPVVRPEPVPETRLHTTASTNSVTAP